MLIMLNWMVEHPPIQVDRNLQLTAALLLLIHCGPRPVKICSISGKSITFSSAIFYYSLSDTCSSC